MTKKVKNMKGKSKNLSQYWKFISQIRKGDTRKISKRTKLNDARKYVKWYTKNQNTHWRDLKDIVKENKKKGIKKLPDAEYIEEGEIEE